MIEYCSTEMMLADFFTNPLQGAAFHRFHDIIMGWKTTESLKESGPIGNKGSCWKCVSTLDHDTCIIIMNRVDEVPAECTSQRKRFGHILLDRPIAKEQSDNTPVYLPGKNRFNSMGVYHIPILRINCQKGVLGLINIKCEVLFCARRSRPLQQWPPSFLPLMEHVWPPTHHHHQPHTLPSMFVRHCATQVCAKRWM